MRFKKLKIFVGISLILFVLIVGNIITFGLMQKYDYEGSDESKVIAPIYANKSSASGSNSQQTTTASTTSAPNNSSTSGNQTTVVQSNYKNKNLIKQA